MDLRETILFKFREKLNKGEKKRIVKKILKPLINIKDSEALILYSLVSNNAKKKLNLALLAYSEDFPPSISFLAELLYEREKLKECYELYHIAANLNEAHAANVLTALYKIGFDGFEKNETLSRKYEEISKNAKKWDFIEGYNKEYIMFEWKI